MIAYACSRVSIAASTFGGDIGSSVSRRPTGLCVPKIRFCNIGGEGHRELGMT